ncbi:MAG: UbiH/UbiF family hydroxylase [Rhodobacteraceae bacterium]|nr:UbiH/UbiF family hydroxylase [Paracoccaceae bacterium]
MRKTDTDILISGGGIAGLTAACAFGTAGFSVLCVDPAPPVTDEGEAGADLRTTAFLQPARTLLERAGLWDRLAPHAAPLQVMRIVDAGGESHDARDIADFDAADISEAPFGWNFPNWLLRRELLARIAELPRVTFRPGTATTTLTTREGDALLGLSNGTAQRCRLLVAADGRNSDIRRQLGIGVATWRYGQKALAFSVQHGKPHNNVSTEIHRTGGPFTFVPLPDLDGRPRSAIVWMETGPRVAELQALPVAAFEAAITERSANLFGPLKLIGRRSVWPIISQHAHRLSGQRSALIGEAAHVVPPIGAQGLNMSLADIRALLDLAIAAPGDLGSAAMLDRYQRARWLDIRARVTGIDLLNRAAMAENPMLRDLRRFGLKTLYDVRPLRHAVMRAGLGAV